MTTNDLTAWLTRFQAELRDDITNGARIDSTRKPGFYYIREVVKHERMGDDRPYVDAILDRITSDDNLLARAAYHAIEEEHGLELSCGCARPWKCDCPKWNFASIDDAAAAVAANREALVEQLDIVDDDECYDEFYAWARSLPELEHLFYEERREHRLDHVFLTRKSGERHARRYEHRYNQPTVYAHHVDESNPDLLNAIRFLAALDLEKSRLVLNQEQQ